MEMVEQKSPFDRNIAVVIGINNYQNGISALKTARPDADRMARILVNQHGYQVKQFIDKAATFQAIWECLKTELPQLIKQSQPQQTRLLFYFAGHGTPPKGEDGEGGFLLPQDASSQQKNAWLSMQDVLNALKDLQCHHLLVILDCCYAGAMVLGSRRDIGGEVEELSKERYSRYINESAWQIITSAAHDQKAIDTHDDTRGVSNTDPNHSPFAALLFDALENQAADYTQDGITTATELHLYLYDNLYKKTANQSNPQISRTWTLPEHDKGEFIFQTGDFNPDELPEALDLNKDNNPYRGLKSFDEAHQRFFFGRTAAIKELQKRVCDRSITIVVGASGAGKSSVVQAGLIPALRESENQQWRILEPIRPGSTPFTALATAVLPLTIKADDPDPKSFQQIHDWLRQARRRSSGDKVLNELFSKWRRTSPDEKLLLVAKHVDLLKEWCGDAAGSLLEDLRKQGLKLSKLVQCDQAELERFKECTRDDAEREQLEKSIQRWKQDVEVWSSSWQKDGKQFGEFVREHCAANHSVKPLLVIDQFEELITQCNEGDRQQFLAALQAALAAFPQLRLVLTLRDDFQYHFEDVDFLKSDWRESCFPLAAMRREQLREAIEQPAQAQVLFFEAVQDANAGASRSLVDIILDDLGDAPGALPLLSFTLSELYYKYLQSDRDDRTFTQKDYQDLGGVKKALTKRATQEYNNLANDYQDGQEIPVSDPLEVKVRRDMLRWVMLRMVTDEGDGRTKRRVLESELNYDTDRKNDHRELVINRFVDARLLVKGKNLEGASYVEPAHDQLVIGWDEIKTWLNERQDKVETATRWPPIQTWFIEKSAKISLPLRLKDANKETARPEAEQPLKVNLPLQRELTTAANHWSSKKAIDGTRQAIGFLWDGDPRLPQLEQTQQSEDNWFNQAEAQFVERSITQKRWNIAWIVIWVSLAFLGVLGFTAYVWYQLQISQMREKATAAQDQSSTSSLNSLVLAIQATGDASRFRPVLTLVDYSLLSAIAAPLRQALRSVDYSLSAAVAESREQLMIQGHEGVVKAVAFSPDGQTIVSGGKDGTIRLWDLTGKPINSFPGSQERHYKDGLGGDHVSKNVNSVAFSPDGQTVASGGDDGIVRLWNLRGQQINNWKTVHQQPVTSVAFSPNGDRIVSMSKDSLWLWNRQTNIPTNLLEVEEKRPYPPGVAFSPDGKYIAASQDRNIILWDINGNKLNFPQQPIPFEEGSQMGISICSIVFSQDSKRIFAGQCKGDSSFSNSSHEVEVWRIEGEKALIQEPKQNLAAHRGSILSLATSPDGRFASGATDGTIHLSYSPAEVSPVLRGHTDRINSLVFSPKDQKLVSASDDGTIRLWDLSNSFGVAKVEYEKDFPWDNIHAVAFNPNGKDFAIARKNSVMVLNKEDYKVKQTFEHPLINQTGGEPVNSIAYSPDGKTVVSGGFDTTPRLWDLKGNKPSIVFPGHGGEVTSVAFSPDGKTIVSGSKDNTLRLWNLEGKQLQVFPRYKEPGHEESADTDGKKIGVTSVAFSPDGKTIVSGAGDKTLRLWNLEGKQLQVFRGHEDRVTSVAFSPGGKTIVSGSADKTLRFWDLQGRTVGPQVVRAHSEAIQSVGFSPNGTMIITAGADRMLKFWSLDGSPASVPLADPDATGQISVFAISPDSQTIVTGMGGAKDYSTSLRMIQNRDNWKKWLELACNRLYNHPVLLNPQTDIEKGARATCEANVWNRPHQPEQNGENIS